MARSFMEFCESFSPCFISQGKNCCKYAVDYLSGLLGKERRKNIENIENDVLDTEYGGLQQFLSDSTWSHSAVMERVAALADSFLGGAEAGLHIDESSFLKKGNSSVGVKRQWSGRAGKLENCQVGVFACLVNKAKFALTDFRLYLPEQWVADPVRCEKAKIPPEHRVYLPKWKQGLEMVRHAKASGVRFGFVGCDSLYGSNSQFINALEDDGEYFMADVNKSVKVYVEEPLVKVPDSEPGVPGRPRKHPRLHEDNAAGASKVESLVKRVEESEFEEIAFRQGEKGKVCGRFYMMTVWHWSKAENRARQRQLLVRKDSDGSLKYSLTNLPPGNPLVYYASRQGQRYFIEHAFHEAKSQLGMAQYQVRLWKGWHHHMALVCMALLFTEKYKDQTKEETPLLTARDITELLAFYLPRRDKSEKEIHARIRKRHELREADRQRRRHHKTGLP